MLSSPPGVNTSTLPNTVAATYLPRAPGNARKPFLLTAALRVCVPPPLLQACEKLSCHGGHVTFPQFVAALFRVVTPLAAYQHDRM